MQYKLNLFEPLKSHHNLGDSSARKGIMQISEKQTVNKLIVKKCFLSNLVRYF